MRRGGGRGFRPFPPGLDCLRLVPGPSFCFRLGACGPHQLGKGFAFGFVESPPVRCPGLADAGFPVAEDAGGPPVEVKAIPAVERAALVAFDVEAVQQPIRFDHGGRGCAGFVHCSPEGVDCVEGARVQAPIKSASGIESAVSVVPWGAFSQGVAPLFFLGERIPDNGMSFDCHGGGPSACELCEGRA